MSPEHNIRQVGSDNMVMDTDFWARVDRSGGPDACWPWTGYRYPRGYGRSSQSGGHSEYAHRRSWELSTGPIPPGMFICHRCDNPPCVNPAHLFLGTAQDNARDRDAKGRDRTSRGYLMPRRAEWKTHCVHGHLYTPENTIRWADGCRRCRECARERQRAYLAWKRAA